MQSFTMKRITIKRVLAYSNSTLICNQTVKNVGRNSRAMNIRNQVLLAINVRQWSSFKSLFFPIFSVLDQSRGLGKLGHQAAICWLKKELSWRLGQAWTWSTSCFLGIKLFCLSRYKASIFSICLI